MAVSVGQGVLLLPVAAQNIPYRHSVPLFPKEEARMYVILSESEISHDRSEKYMPVSSPVGFFISVIRHLTLAR